MKVVTFSLPDIDAGQLLDGLEVLIEQWSYTADYLETGCVRDDVSLRACHNSEEALFLSEYYASIRDSLRDQYLRALKSD
jgi:hypothetical protein